MAHRTVRVPATPCPYCGTSNDAATDPTEDRLAPAPGDVSVCFTCGEFLLFDHKLRTRKPTYVELAGLATDPAARTIKADWVRYQGWLKQG